MGPNVAGGKKLEAFWNAVLPALLLGVCGLGFTEARVSGSPAFRLARKLLQARGAGTPRCKSGARGAFANRSLCNFFS